MFEIDSEIIWTGIIACEIANYGFKYYFYKFSPDLKRDIQNRIKLNMDEKKDLPKLRAYAPLYLPLPFDYVEELTKM
jgi:hypothetical protein